MTDKRRGFKKKDQAGQGIIPDVLNLAGDSVGTAGTRGGEQAVWGMFCGGLVLPSSGHPAA